jgi:hypothetical protein
VHRERQIAAIKKIQTLYVINKRRGGKTRAMSIDKSAFRRYHYIRGFVYRDAPDQIANDKEFTFAELQDRVKNNSIRGIRVFDNHGWKIGQGHIGVVIGGELKGRDLECEILIGSPNEEHAAAVIEKCKNGEYSEMSLAHCHEEQGGADKDFAEVSLCKYVYKAGCYYL